MKRLLICLLLVLGCESTVTHTHTHNILLETQLIGRWETLFCDTIIRETGETARGEYKYPNLCPYAWDFNIDGSLFMGLRMIENDTCGAGIGNVDAYTDSSQSGDAYLTWAVTADSLKFGYTAFGLSTDSLLIGSECSINNDTLMFATVNSSDTLKYDKCYYIKTCETIKTGIEGCEPMQFD